MATQLILWLKLNWLELFSVLASLVYLYFSVKQIIWLWPLGILSSALAIWVYFRVALYAEMGLNAYYIAISLYGWWYWTRPNSLSYHTPPVKHTTAQQALRLGLTGLVLYWVILLMLRYLPQQFGFAQASLPWLDAFVTAASVIATYMLARKQIEHWLLWVVIDIIAAGMYFHKKIWLYALLFIVYTLMALVGYRQWKQNPGTRASA